MMSRWEFSANGVLILVPLLNRTLKSKATAVYFGLDSALTFSFSHTFNRVGGHTPFLRNTVESGR